MHTCLGVYIHICIYLYIYNVYTYLDVYKYVYIYKYTCKYISTAVHLLNIDHSLGSHQMVMMIIISVLTACTYLFFLIYIDWSTSIEYRSLPRLHQMVTMIICIRTYRTYLLTEHLYSYLQHVLTYPLQTAHFYNLMHYFCINCHNLITTLAE
jgi:hypothetical protein